MSVKDLYPAIRPSLNLDFANTKTLDPRITFSRASTGTYYDGVTHAKAEENLLQYSQEFDNSYWVDSSTTTTADDTAAPDGTTTAEKLAVLGNSNPQYLYKNGVFTQTSTGYTLSIYAKAGTLSYFFLAYRGNSSNVAIAEWDLSAGTLNASNASGTAVIDSTSITSVGSGWYRLVLSVTTSTGNADARFAFGPTDGTFNTFGYYAGSTAGDAYAWGAQLEQRSSVTAYTPTPTQPITNYIPVLQSAAAGAARFYHDPVTGESKGLLIEGQRTNLLLRSEEFDDAAWGKTNVSIDSNVIVAPDGNLTADKLVESSGSSAKILSYTSFVGNTYTMSVYAKSAGKNYIRLCAQFGVSQAVVNFDLTNGQSTGDIYNSGVNQTYSNLSYGSVSVGNGWWRIYITYTVGSGGYSYLAIALSDTASVSYPYAPTYTGDGYSGIYIWGAQLEAGAFPTSYFKTTSAQATRNTDSVSMTGTNFSEWYRQDKGTILAEVTTPAPANASNGRIWYATDGSIVQRIELYQGSSGDSSPRFLTLFRYGNSTVANFLIQTTNAGLDTDNSEFIKLGLSYEVDNITLDSNKANNSSTDTSGNIPLVNQVSFTHTGNYKKLAYYPARLTNAQLQALTEG